MEGLNIDETQSSPEMSDLNVTTFGICVICQLICSTGRDRAKIITLSCLFWQFPSTDSPRSAIDRYTQ
jgi:hypothetical protein